MKDTSPVERTPGGDQTTGSRPVSLPLATGHCCARFLWPPATRPRQERPPRIRTWCSHPSQTFAFRAAARRVANSRAGHPGFGDAPTLSLPSPTLYPPPLSTPSSLDRCVIIKIERDRYGNRSSYPDRPRQRPSPASQPEICTTKPNFRPPSAAARGEDRERQQPVEEPKLTNPLESRSVTPAVVLVHLGKPSTQWLTANS
jgi:hypothetical protein